MRAPTAQTMLMIKPISTTQTFHELALGVDPERKRFRCAMKRNDVGTGPSPNVFCEKAEGTESNALEVSLPFPVGDRVVERGDFQTRRVHIKIHDVIAKDLPGKLASLEQIRRFAQRLR